VRRGKPEDCTSQVKNGVPEEFVPKVQIFEDTNQLQAEVSELLPAEASRPREEVVKNCALKRPFVEYYHEDDDVEEQASNEVHDQSRLQVARPIVHQQKRMRFTDVSSTRAKIYQSIVSKIMLRVWDAGYSKAELDSLFGSLTPGLLDTINEALRAFETLAWIKEQSVRQASAASAVTGFVTPETACQTPHDLQIAPQESAIRDNFDSLGCGWWSLSWDPATGRRIGMEVNKALSSLTQLHPEELLGRAGHSDVKLPCSQLEFFCTVLDDLCNAGQKYLVRYSTITPQTQGRMMDTILVRRESFRTFNEEGKIVLVQHMLTRVSEEEYDEVYRSDPSLCRPFSSVLGDYRTASEIVAETPRDILFDGQFARMAQTAEGAKKLKRLEACLRLRFEPIIQHAENESRKFAAAVGNAVTAAADGPAVDFGHRHITRTATDPVIEPQSLPQPRA